MKLESQIPKGCYCYTEENGKYVPCPFWYKVPNKHEQENGYCSYISKGDWEWDGTFLLFDQCKECGVNDEDYEKP